MLYGKFRGIIALAGSLGLAMSAGCAKTVTVEEAVFFPPKPNPPRVQFLTGISTSSDVEGKEDSFSLLRLSPAEDKEERGIGKPYGIAIKGSFIYVCDLMKSKLIIIDFEKKKFSFLKGDLGAGKLKKPVGVAVDAEGNIFVADTMRKDVAMYAKNGDYVRSYGKEVTKNPVAVGVDAENVYILDNRSNLVKILDRKTGEMVSEVGNGPTQMDTLALPIAMYKDDDGVMHVTNLLSGRLLSFDRDGHLIRGFGKLGDGFGDFGRPRGIFVDRDGFTYVVDASHQNAQIFNATGRLLMFFGDPGLPRGSMNMPSGIAVSAEMVPYFKQYADPGFELEKIIFVTNQFGKDKISIYGLGSRKDSQSETKDAKAK